MSTDISDQVAKGIVKGVGRLLLIVVGVVVTLVAGAVALGIGRGAFDAYANGGPIPTKYVVDSKGVRHEVDPVTGKSRPEPAPPIRD